MRSTLCRTLGVGLITIMVGGCALNPVTGRPEVVLITASREQQIGEEEAQKVEQEMGFVDAPALAAYVEAVGQRLAEQSPRRDIAYRFYVVDMPEPNAFALPGGYVYVSRGLLELVNSEDELACVIGHEIGHVAARHSVQQVSRAAPFAVVTNLSAAVAGIASPLLGQVVGGAGSLASGLVLAPFDRDQEREADRVGQQLAAAAGWDPGALSQLLRTLQREEELDGTARRHVGFLDSHPSTPERVANTAKFAGTLKRVTGEPLSPTRAVFLARLDGLVVGSPAAAGVFDGQSFLQPDLDFYLRFPDRWITQNGRQQVDAVASDRSALVAVGTVAAGDDPLAGARALQKASRSPVLDHTQPSTVGDLKAARTRVQARDDSGEAALNFAWIAHAGRIYQIAGVTAVQRSDAFQPVFEQVVRSFRPLQPQERAGIREHRLRILEARAGESLDALVARSKTSWSFQKVAVANGLAGHDVLEEGQLVKIAVAEPYGTTNGRPH